MKFLFIDLEKVRNKEMARTTGNSIRSIHELAWTVAELDEDGLHHAYYQAYQALDMVAISRGLEATDTEHPKVQRRLAKRPRFIAKDTLKEVLEILAEDLANVDYVVAHNGISEEQAIINQEFQRLGIDAEITTLLDSRVTLAYCLEKSDSLHEDYSKLYHSGTLSEKQRDSMVWKGVGCWNVSLNHYYRSQGVTHPHDALEDSLVIEEITRQAFAMGGLDKMLVEGPKNKNHSTSRKAE